MTIVEVAADLRVRDGAANRVLNVTDWQAAATGAASQVTLAAVLAELAQKLEPADVAALATAARQDAAQALLNGLLAALQGTLAVTGPQTDVQARAAPQPVSGTVAVSNPTTGSPDVSDRAGRVLGHVSVDSLPSLAAGAATIGKTDQGAGGVSAWKVDGSAVTQPVSSATLPLPTGAAKDATLTDGTQRVGGTVAVSGPLTDAQLRASPVAVSGFPATQPVSGTVAVSNPTANPETGLAKDTSLASILAKLSADPSTAAKQDLLLTATQAAGDFKRLAKAEPMPGEELRFDDIAAADLYIGAAPDGTATSAASFKVARYYRDAATGNITRARYRTGVAWDSHTVGWT